MQQTKMTGIPFKDCIRVFLGKSFICSKEVGWDGRGAGGL